MADKKPKKEIRTTPRGEFVGFIAVAEANTKFKKEGEYKIAIALPADHEWVQKAIKGIDKAAEKALADAIENDKRDAAKKKKAPWKLNEQKCYDNELDPESGDETGRVIFKFGAKASGVRKKDGKPWTKTIKLFDAAGNRCKVNPWKSSEGCISFTMNPYAVSAEVGAGVSLSLEAVQVIKLVSGGDDMDAEGYGFTKQEGGFTASEDDDASDSSDEKTEGNVASTSSDDDDF